MRDTLENRMKLYEEQCSQKITNDFIVVRVDGKAFSHIFRYLNEQHFYSEDVVSAMNQAAFYTALSVQNCVAYYPQSDECSFLLQAKKENNTQHWFNGKVNKINSVTASYFTYYFNKFLPETAKKSESLNDVSNLYVPVFDCRCFGLPDDKPEEVLNYFVWRVKDAYRNVLNRFVHFYQPSYLYSSRKITTKQKEIQKYLEIYGKGNFSFPFNHMGVRMKANGVWFTQREINPPENIFGQIRALFEEYNIVKLEGEKTNDF